MSRKLLSFPLLLIFAITLAAAYGAIHNQISYTVSPGYFHDFKFDQFGVPAEQRTRGYASLVGVLASWWMGIIIGLPIGIAALFSPDAKTMRRLFHKAAILVVAITLGIGLLALLYGHLFFDEQSAAWITNKIETSDPVNFMRAGNMHNFSYLGGLIGLVTGLIYVIVKVRRQKTQ